MSNRHLLAMDLGLRCGWACGYTAFTADAGPLSGTLRTLSGPSSGVWRLDKAEPRDHPGARFAELRGKIELLYPAVIAYEDVKRHPGGGTIAAHVYGGWLAILQTFAHTHGVELMPLGVTEVKKFATGKGTADKAAMVAWARANGHAVKDHNEADALAVWYCARERLANV